MTAEHQTSSAADPDRPPRAGDAAAAPQKPWLADFPPSVVEATLERVLASDAFRRSRRHRHFLQHVVRAALANEQEQLKEVIIGLEVFGRALATYDPRRDPIVRVEAGRLREKLVRFYADEGAAEPFEITIPVGSYKPVIIRRPSSRSVVRRSIAILPFSNLSGVQTDAAFAIGLADQLIDTLGRVPALKVVSRVSALQASQKALSAKAISALLGVGYLVEGSIQRSGTRVRCIARLTRAKGSEQVWSRRFENDEAYTPDVFAFQDAIADAVLAAVSATSLDEPIATRAEAPASAPPQRALLTQNPQARDLFERARYLGLQGSIDGYTKAIELLEKSIALDPRFAQAHSQLGAARANLAPYVFAPTIPSFLKVKASVERALELDPLDGDAHALLAVIAHRIEKGWTFAEPMFLEALRVAPNSTLAHSSYAWALVFNGRHAEAIAHARIAMELDPLNLAQRAYNARLYSYACEYEAAIGELRIVLELDPEHLYARLVLGIVYLSTGRLDDAMPLFERVSRDVPSHTSAPLHLICIHGLRGDIERGRRELEALLARWHSVPATETIHYSRFYVALARACLGDRERMLEALEQCAREHDYLFVTTPAHVLFDPYRDDPEFADLLRRHGLQRLPR